MKRTTIFLLLLFVGCKIFAQAKPSFNQYILNNYILNPAISGIENYTDIKVSYRDQWSSIPGAPITSYATLHLPIGKSDYLTSATSFGVPGENPRGPEYWRDYTAPEAHHGIGFAALNDRAGYINRWTLTASYAYHKPIGVKTTLSGGFSAGISAVNVDRSKIYWASLNPNDPAVGYATGELKKIVPELGVGLWLYSAKYFAGMSVLNIVPGKIRYGGTEKYGTYYEPNAFITAGYRIQASDDISVLPSIMAQYWKPQLWGAHFNIKTQYRDLFWLGASVRAADLVGGYSAMAGINISNTFNISYAYEMATTKQLRSYTGNTHEIMLGFTLGNRYRDNCPRNIW